jgi:hypothetical protein
MGLNTQDSSLDLASGFALTAVNCVIDQFGRIGARKGWVAQNTSNAALGTSDVKAMGELITDDGFHFILVAGNNKLFRLNAGVLTEITYGGGGTAPAITDSNWKIAVLNGCMYFFQGGHDPLVFEPAVSTTTYKRVSEKTGYAGTVPQADEVISAYGRLWAVSTTTNKSTVYFSDLLSGHVWTTGTAGSLDVTTVWPKGGDIVVGLGAHNGFLYLFGRSSILVYQGATSPASMTLADSVVGIGCIARDTIKATGTDIIFLSDTGVRSIQRTIQEKSAPHRDLSKNVRTDLMANVASEGNQSIIKAVYSPFESFYLLSLPTLKMVYCFDLKQVMQDGSSRVTTWDSIQPKSFLYCRDESLLIGKEGFVGKYSGYQDNGGSYRFQYFTNHTDLGAPSVSSVLKKLTLTVIGGSNQYVTTKWGYDFSGNYQAANVKIAPKGIAFFGTSEYNTAEYTGGTNLEAIVAYPTGSGKVIQTGYEADINGSALSIQKIEIAAKNGKVV